MKKLSIRRSGEGTPINNNMYLFEHAAWENNSVIYGVDEAGRGCMAGPVVIAAAMLHTHQQHPLLIDSKLLTQTELTTMYQWLQSRAVFSVSIASPRLIDQHNIYRCTAQQMRQALLHLLMIAPQPQQILIDAMPLNLHNTPFATIPLTSMIKGESKSASIAAASIIAKVTRDRIMKNLETTFPGYGLAQHKGYCTKQHQQTVKHLHPSIIHRKSFLSWLTKDTTHEQQTIFC